MTWLPRRSRPRSCYCLGSVTTRYFADGPRPGTVYLVRGGTWRSGTADARAATLLAGATEVYHDYLVSEGVLARCNPQARLIDVGKTGHGPQTAQDVISGSLWRLPEPVIASCDSRVATRCSSAAARRRRSSSTPRHSLRDHPGFSSALASRPGGNSPDGPGTGHVSRDSHRPLDQWRPGADSRRRYHRRPDGRGERGGRFAISSIAAGLDAVVRPSGGRRVGQRAARAARGRPRRWIELP